MKNKIIVGIFALLAIIGMSFAWGGAMMQNDGERPELSDEVKAEIKEALENKDFEALRAIHEEYGIPPPRFAGEKPELTEEEKAQLMELREEIHEAMESEDFETVKELRDEMKELLPEGHFGKFGPGMHRGCHCPGEFVPDAEPSE